MTLGTLHRAHYRAACREDHAAAHVLNAALGVRYTGIGAPYPQPFDPRDAERLAEIERDYPELFHDYPAA